MGKVWYIVAVAVIVSCMVSPAAAAGDNPTKYLIFHVDAIPTDLFLDEMDAGNLPHMTAFFADGGLVPSVLSLWPGGTEMIYTRMKGGYSNAEYPILGWQYLDRKNDRWVDAQEIVLSMFFKYTPRRGSMFTLYAHPPALDFLAAAAMQNVPHMLQRYDVLEVLWFATDHAGHVTGLESQLASLYRFDRAFGQLMDALDADDINVILYSDHGMSYESAWGEPAYVVSIKDTVPALFGEELRKVYYPNIYLYDPELAPEAAQHVLRNVDTDWTFYWEDDQTMMGLNQNGRALFHYRDGLYRYEVLEGPDYFGYDALGYGGEYLNADEWLALTKDSVYPGAVPNIVGAARNPNAGEVMFLMNPPRIAQSLPTNIYNHKGVSRSDLLVPVLFRGPDLEHLYSLESFWLHDLYTVYVPGIPFDERPERDWNKVSARIPFDGRSWADGFVSLRLSPEYRWRFGASYDQGDLRFSSQFDVFSTFISRLWLGLDLRQHPQRNSWNVGTHVELELRYGQWGGGLALERFDGQWDLRPRLAYYSSDYRFSVELTDMQIGISYHW